MMSRWCDQSIPDERHSAFSSGPLEVAVLFGTLVAETILASVHVRAHKQAGHMDASDLIKHCKTPCKEGVVHIWEMASLRFARCFACAGERPSDTSFLAARHRSRASDSETPSAPYLPIVNVSRRPLRR